MKNLLLFLALFLTTASIVAQLYVKPNGTTDSYVYVDNEILFVEQDVNLVINTNNPDTEASIYLRNEAQLIQGTTATANSGTGFLSVFQNTPDDDSWDYSFWGSPVGNYITGSGNENFGILRINDSITLTNSTVTATTAAHNGTISPLTISTRWLYRYPAGGPWSAIGTGNNVTPGYGFIMKGVGTTNHSQLYDFRGRANNGTMSVAVTNAKSTLSGNPYPSALDLNRMFYDTDSSNIDGDSNLGNDEIDSFRYWDEDRSIDSHYYLDNKGGYGVWIPGSSNPNGTNAGMYTVAPFLNYDNGGNPSGGSTGSGVNYERRFAPIGQGFMIYGASTGTINIQNKYRRYIVEGATNNSQFRGPTGGSTITDSSSGGSVISSETPFIRIYTQFEESHFRDMLLAFSDQSTDGYDRGLDARHPMDATSEAYFPIRINSEYTDPFVIQTVPFYIGKKIPIAFTLDQEFKFSVKAVEEVNIQNAAYLWDRDEDTYKKITGGEEAVQTLPAGVYENRFYIVFRGQREMIENSKETIVKETIKANVDFFQNNPVKQLEVSNPEGYDIKSALIFDMSGKLVVSKSNIGTSKNFTFSTANLSDGVYLVKLTTTENIDIDYKMVIYN